MFTLRTVFIALFATVLAFAVGTGTGLKKKTEQVRELQAQIEQERAVGATYREKIQENERKLVTAIEERDKAAAMADSLRTQLAGMRVQSAKLSSSLRALSASRANTGDSDGKSDGRCERLLAEGTELLGSGSELLSEGSGLLARINADKEALNKIVK